MLVAFNPAATSATELRAKVHSFAYDAQLVGAWKNGKHLFASASGWCAIPAADGRGSSTRFGPVTGVGWPKSRMVLVISPTLALSGTSPARFGQGLDTGRGWW